jgi:TRAP-type transport system periplasmic protein
MKFEKSKPRRREGREEKTRRHISMSFFCFASVLRVLRVFAVALLLLPAAVLAAPEIKLATLAPKGTTFDQELRAMKDQWAKAPGGGVRLTLYTDGTLGGETDMVRRMRVGQIQAAMLTVTGLTEIDDSVAAIQNMPMMFRSADELEHVRDKLRPMFEQKFKDKGFIVLFWGDAGWVRFFSKKPATTPDDFKQMKLFALANHPKSTELWKHAGFRVVELEVTDILTGLNTGLIDAVPSEPYYALAGQFYGPAPYMVDVKWAPLVGGTVITTKAFNALPAETQKALLASAAATGKKLTAESRARSEEAIDAMKKRGLKVTPITPQIEAAWRKTCEDAYPGIRGSIVPAEMFDQVQKLLGEYRKSGGKPSQ